MESADKDLAFASGSDEYLQGLTFHKFIIASLPVAVITVNSKLEITSFNPRAERLTGYSVKEAMGRYCGEILRGGMCNINCPLKTVISRQNPIVRLETTVVNKRGETIPVGMSTAALLDDEGNLVGGVEAFQDISRVKELEREKDSFVSMIAHDMKGSITVIGGFVLRLLAKARDIDEEKEKKYLGIVKNESSKLESLVNDFLEFSRLQTGKLKLDFGPTSLDKELMELVDSRELKASQSRIKLALQNEQPLPLIDADARQLRRVFANLLDNALKFSREGGKIIIATYETDHDVIVKFIDQGAGINPMDLPYIFDPFHRGQARRKTEGFGLGLATVKAIVEGHGGRVLAESELGKGSIFSVVLPKAAEPEMEYGIRW
ncbi:MAG: PAS domain-containing sensor histidine kinase [Desulfobacteraceae bacterium]|jgi:two-component system phosphate regulon sensor histidine kinase PhoR